MFRCSGSRRSSGHRRAPRARVLGASCGHLQGPQADQSVGGSDEEELPFDPRGAAMAELAQAAGRFHPAKHFFDAFADPLADRVARLPGRARIDRTVRGLRDVGRDAEGAGGFHPRACVIGFVDADSVARSPRPSCDGDHDQGQELSHAEAAPARGSGLIDHIVPVSTTGVGRSPAHAVREEPGEGSEHVECRPLRWPTS